MHGAGVAAGGVAVEILGGHQQRLGGARRLGREAAQDQLGGVARVDRDGLGAGDRAGHRVGAGHAA